jgi:hypothetical protein
MDTWVWILIAVVVVALIVIVLAAWSRSRRHGLHDRFGSEYDRTVEGADSRRKAERELREREAEHDELDLRTQVMRDRGYPVDDFEAKSRLVSVDHPDVVENYRKGHGIYLKTVEGSASTEDLRQAVISYRALFEELVRQGAEAEPGPSNN